MTSPSQLKVTYASVSGPSEELHQAYEAAIAPVKAGLGQHHPMFINGEPLRSDSESVNTSPADTRMVLGYFQKGQPEHARAAIAAAKAAFRTWGKLPWPERIARLRRAADHISDHKFELAVLLSLEAGKNRLEALGDVEESADLIRYYCQQVELNNGYAQPLGQSSPTEKTCSVLKPWGVWVVISPFNFPMALATGMCAGALAAGNTVVFKPAGDTPYSGLKLYEAMAAAGLPEGVFNYLSGSGRVLGDELATNPDVSGCVFTGSLDVGSALYRRFSEKAPRPCITEMGGKNPCIIMPSADLEQAADGVTKSAFGFDGQKCSACSRVYIHRDVKARFTELLVERARKLKVGFPLERDTYMGPLINAAAYRDYQTYVEQAHKDGHILFGGQIVTAEPFNHGYYVTPTLVDQLPKDHHLFKHELFLPILCLTDVSSLAEALDWCNRSEFGLTAGIFSRNPEEVRYFFDNIEAGVTYANRAAGATTGAWPGIQSFGGWKGSGSSGKGALGPYYVQQFLREQSQTRVE
ncbi:MAG: aldehyde dehydrogenase family protein [Acidobacteria bacterium]|nr:aldehyde dehydrogenase family protein [Acidobacteriota bacterium]MBI3658440.1 aldehyde dehydrogenase family protein [Acidobacteriota bacterium]